MARKSDWTGTLAGLDYNSSLDDKIKDLFKHFDIQDAGESPQGFKNTKPTRANLNALSKALSEYCTTFDECDSPKTATQNKTKEEKLTELVIALANKQKIPAFTIKPLEIEMKDCLTKIEEIVFWYEIRLFAFKNNFSSIYSAIEDYTLQDNIRLFDLLLDKKK